MKILGIESSALVASVAIWEDGVITAEYTVNFKKTHSQTLLPMIDEIFRMTEQDKDSIDAIAIAAGPGSFTGLRIGVATAKGLAWAGDKDCAPCSTLESKAWPLAHMEGKVIVCAMDARRSQVYNALFLATGDGLERLSEDRAISLADLAEEVKKYENEKIVVGDGAKLCYNTLSEMGLSLTLAPEHLRMQSGWGVARAAEELAKQEKLIKGEALNAVYHRLSQAERERMEKQKNT